MSRVINTQSPGKIRSQLMRTCAELLRHLSQKQAVDDEAKDMAVLLWLCLHRIDDGIDESAAAWEKRDYWMKAERLRERWSWVGREAARLDALIRSQAWDQLPEALMRLLPRFSEVKVTRFTRASDLWQGAYHRFLEGNLDLLIG